MCNLSRTVNFSVIRIKSENPSTFLILTCGKDRIEKNVKAYFVKFEYVILNACFAVFQSKVQLLMAGVEEKKSEEIARLKKEAEFDMRMKTRQLVSSFFAANHGNYCYLIPSIIIFRRNESMSSKACWRRGYQLMIVDGRHYDTMLIMLIFAFSQILA